MAIYDQSYQPWEGTRQSRLRRVWALVLACLRLPFQSTWNLVVVGLIYMLVLGWIFVLYIVASTDNPPIFVLGNNLYRDWFFNLPLFGFLIMILSATVGAAMISRDLQHNALLTYFSKAITRTDYLAAKFLTLVILLLSVTLGPALLLFVGQIAMGTEDLTWTSRIRDLSAVIAHSLIIAVPFAAIVLCFSSLTKRPYVAAMLWILFYLTTWGLPPILDATSGASWNKIVRLQTLTAHAGNACYESRPFRLALIKFDLPQEIVPVPSWVCLLILAAVTGACLAIVRVRLRIPEVRE